MDKSRRPLFLKSHLRYIRSMYIVQYYMHVSLLSSSPSVAAEICGSSCQVDEKSVCDVRGGWRVEESYLAGVSSFTHALLAWTLSWSDYRGSLKASR